jgi:hypothetical protein
MTMMQQWRIRTAQTCAGMTSQAARAMDAKMKESEQEEVSFGDL